ncbi:MAG: hypothetical protein RIT11_564, partial [Pseudomonadota bacterium]
LKTLIKALTCNPAKILNINAGNLSIGADADIAVVNLDKPWVIEKEKIKSKSKNTAIEKRKMQGKVEKTFINGNLVFEAYWVNSYKICRFRRYKKSWIWEHWRN